MGELVASEEMASGLVGWWGEATAAVEQGIRKSKDSKGIVAQMRNAGSGSGSSHIVWVAVREPEESLGTGLVNLQLF
jgi:hypothetical protein